MRLRNIKTLCFVSALVQTLQGCSTTEVRVRKRSPIEVCVPDPRNDSLQCAETPRNKADCESRGFTWNHKWDRCEFVRRFQSLEEGTHICFPIDPITKILEDE